MKIEALKPPYNVYNKDEKIIIKAVIHKDVSETYFTRIETAVTSAIRNTVM